MNGVNDLSRTYLFEWYKPISEGEKVEDDARPGSLVTARTKEKFRK